MAGHHSFPSRRLGQKVESSGASRSLDDRGSSRVVRDLILECPKFVVSQLQIRPIGGERSEFDKVIELRRPAIP